jgi:hypothetical protein
MRDGTTAGSIDGTGLRRDGIGERGRLADRDADNRLASANGRRDNRSGEPNEAPIGRGTEPVDPNECNKSEYSCLGRRQS